MRVFTSLCCAVALAILLVPGARADENDRLTYMTFSGPVQVPGVTLAAGTYTFKIADTASRHVVQIFSKDDNKLITTVMTIPNERLEPVKDTFVMFQERPTGTPVAVKAWFYPGRSIGEEFLYPKQQAMTIARASGESVLSTDDVNDSSAKVGHINERGDVDSASSSTTASSSSTTASTASTTTAPAASTTTASAASTTTAPRASTTTAPSASTTTAPSATTTTASNNRASEAATTTAPAATPARAQESPATTAARQAQSETIPAPAPESAVGTSGQAPASAPAAEAAPRLPRTASPLALFELVSALSLAGGFGVRQLRKRV